MLIIGIIIGAVLSWIPLLLGLKHDSREREKERQMSLRRDVYLSAAEKIGQQLSYLTNFYQTGDPLPKGYEEAITKIHIIGNNETVNSVNKFNDCLVKAYCELGPEKQEFNFLGMESDNIIKFTQEAAVGVNKSLEDMKEYNLSGVINPQKWSYIQGEYDLHCKHRDQSLKELDKNIDKQLNLTYNLAIKCRQKTQLAEELLTPVIVAIRKELNTPFDEDAYRAMMKISQDKWKKNLEKYIASMKEKWTQGRQTLAKDDQNQ